LEWKNDVVLRLAPNGKNRAVESELSRRLPRQADDQARLRLVSLTG
jgi:hypothetical protein